jgi:hypothetical protein
MGSYSVEGISEYKLNKTQEKILARFGITVRSECVPEKVENGRKKYAHILTVFEWEGSEPPIPNSVLCYEDDEWPNAIPKALGHSTKKAETMNLSTHGLGGEKD